MGREWDRPLRSPRTCDLAGPHPALNRPEQTRALGMQAKPWGTEVPASVFILSPMSSQGFTPPHPRTDGRPGGSVSHLEAYPAGLGVVC